MKGRKDRKEKARSVHFGDDSAGFVTRKVFGNFDISDILDKKRDLIVRACCLSLLLASRMVR